MDEQKKQRSEFTVVGEVQGWQEEIEASIKVPTLTELQYEPSLKDTKQRELEFESSKVKFDSLYSVWDDAIERKFEVGDPVITDGILEKMGMIDVAPQETMEIDEDALANHVNSEVIVESITGFEVNSMGVFEISAAHKVFVEMPIQLIAGFDEQKISDIAIVDWRCSYLAIFDPGGGSIDLMSRNVADMTKMGMVLCHCVESSSSFVVVVPTVLAMNLVFDPGGMCYLKSVKIVVSYEVDIAGQSILEQNFNLKFIRNGQQSLPFDRGRVGKNIGNEQLFSAHGLEGIYTLLLSMSDRFYVESCFVEMVESNQVLGGIMILYPGGRLGCVWMVFDATVVCVGLVKNPSDWYIIPFAGVLRDLRIVPNANSAVGRLGACIEAAINKILIFDPGGVFALITWDFSKCV